MQIELSRGMSALVDPEDYELLSQFKWCATPGQKTFYAVRGKAVEKRKRTLVQMHRQILGEPPFDKAEVDHINGNGLDNRRANLRWCTKKENRRNESKREGYANKYKGVSFSASRQKFRAYIRHNETQKQIHLGYFTSEVDAANAYDLKAKELFKDFARLNCNSAK